jgi:hypothetical protein
MNEISLNLKEAIMKFLDTYESILIWLLRRGIQVVSDDDYVFYQFDSILYTPYEDDKTHHELLKKYYSDNPRLLLRGKQLTTKDKLYLKAMIPFLQEQGLLEKNFNPVTETEWIYLAEVDDDFMKMHISNERDVNPYEPSIISVFQTLLGENDQSWGQKTPLTWAEIETYKWKINIFDPWEFTFEVEPVTIRLENAISAEDIKDPKTNEILVSKNTTISKKQAMRIAESDLDSVSIYFKSSDIQICKDYEEYWEQFKVQHIRPYL